MLSDDFIEELLKAAPDTKKSINRMKGIASELEEKIWGG